MIIQIEGTFEDTLAQLRAHGLTVEASSEYCDGEGRPITYFVAEERAFRVNRDDGTFDIFMPTELDNGMRYGGWQIMGDEPICAVDVIEDLSAYEGRMAHATQITDRLYAVTLTKEGTFAREVAEACKDLRPDYDDLPAKTVPTATLEDLLMTFGKVRFVAWSKDAHGRELRGTLRVIRKPGRAPWGETDFD